VGEGAQGRAGQECLNGLGSAGRQGWQGQGRPNMTVEAQETIGRDMAATAAASSAPTQSAGSP
jgi:hypothetical protein